MPSSKSQICSMAADYEEPTVVDLFVDRQEMAKIESNKLEGITFPNWKFPTIESKFPIESLDKRSLVLLWYNSSAR